MNTDLRNKALAQLQKIKEDGTIAATDANTSIVTPNADGKSVTAVVISVGTKGEPDKVCVRQKKSPPNPWMKLPQIVLVLML